MRVGRRLEPGWGCPLWAIALVRCTVGLRRHRGSDDVQRCSSSLRMPARPCINFASIRHAASSQISAAAACRSTCSRVRCQLCEAGHSSFTPARVTHPT